MGFWAATKAFFADVKAKTFSYLGFGDGNVIGSGGPGSPSEARSSAFDAARWLRTFKRCTDLKQPVQRLAQDVAAVRFWFGRVVGQGSDGSIHVKKLLNHRLIELWKRPNFMMNTDQFLELGMTWLETTGRWPTLIERDKAGFPAALWPIVPTDLLRMPTKRRPTWKFRLNGKVQECAPSDMIWIAYLDPERPYGWGASPCEAVADEVAQIQYANKWNLNHFRNGARLGKIIGVPGLNKTSGPAIQADFDARFKGVDNAGKSFFVGTGIDANGKVTPNISVTDLAHSHVEMDFKEILDFQSDKVAGNWNVPRSILGRKGNANRSEGDNDVKFYQRQSVAPRAALLQQHFQLQLVGEFGEADLWIGFDDPVEESKQFLLEQSNQGVKAGTITINEWRLSQGKESFGPIGDVLTIPVNMAVVPKDISLEELLKLLAGSANQTQPANGQPATLSLTAEVTSKNGKVSVQ